MTSFFGRFFLHLEKGVCYNFRLFFGRHEKAVQILFLLIYVFLQLILVFCLPGRIITVVVVLFLFFLALERICLHVWVEYERRRYREEGDKIKTDYETLKKLAYKEIYSLRERIKSLQSNSEEKR